MFQPGTRVSNPYRGIGIILERVDQIPGKGTWAGLPGYLVWWNLCDTNKTDPYGDRADDALRCPENQALEGNLQWVPMDRVHDHYNIEEKQ